MLKEKPPQSSEKEEEPIDLALKKLLLEASTINHGNNGIIKRIGIGEFGEELEEYLEKNCAYCPEADKIVFKMLKVYSKGRGKEEFEAQKKAYDIIEKARGDKGDKRKYASVPRPYVYRELKVDDDIRQMLGAENLDKDQEKIEILLMDYIEGEDLATKLYKEVLKNHPKAVHLREKAEEMSVEELYEHAASCLDFKKPGGKSRDDRERLFESEAINADNAKRLIDFLKKAARKNGDTFLDPEMIEAIENSIKLFHSNNLFHRDLHERNIMIGKKDRATYIVDYGQVKDRISSGDENDIYIEGEKRFVDDRSIIERYKSLTLPEAIEKNNKVTGQEEGLKKVLENKEFGKVITEVLKEMNEDNIGNLSDQVASKFYAYNSESFYDAKLLVVIRYVEIAEIENRKEVLQNIVRKSNFPPFFKNKLVNYAVSYFNLG